MAGTVKLTLRLSDAEYGAVEYLAEQYGISKTDAIRRAIQREKYLAEQSVRGSKLLLEDRKGKMFEIELA